MRGFQRDLNKESGSALFLAVVLLTLLAGLGIAQVAVQQKSIQQSSFFLSRGRLRKDAESGGTQASARSTWPAAAALVNALTVASGVLRSGSRSVSVCDVSCLNARPRSNLSFACLIVSTRSLPVFNQRPFSNSRCRTSMGFRMILDEYSWSSSAATTA